MSSSISMYPYLTGISEDGEKRLHGVKEVAEFICDKGRHYDLRVVSPDGEQVLNTFGIYIDRICDMEYRNELLAVLIPIQHAVEREAFEGSVDDMKDEEIDTLNRIFAAMKMDDIEVGYDENDDLRAVDGDGNEWKNKEVYEFILFDALHFEPDGKLSDGFYVDEDLLEKIKGYAAAYEVSVTEPTAASEETEDELDAEP